MIQSHQQRRLEDYLYKLHSQQLLLENPYNLENQLLLHNTQLRHLQKLDHIGRQLEQ
jgi:hypothetical protein